MKINEFAIVDPKVDEAPQGFLKRAGLGIASKLPGDFGHRAKGKLLTGKMANQIKQAFMTHLGASGREANAEELIKFLKLNKYPTQGVEKMAKDMANKDKFQKGPMAGADDEEGEDNRIQFASPDEIKKFGTESVEEAELKGSQIDKLIMKAATDAYDVKAGYGGTGLDNLKGSNQGGGQSGGDDKETKKALQRLKSETGIENVNMAVQALNKLSTGKQVTKQEINAIAPLLSGLVNSLQDPQGINKTLQMMKQGNKS